MSRKTIIILAVILAAALVGAGLGYKSLTSREKEKSAAAQEVKESSDAGETAEGDTVPFAPEEPAQELPAASDFTVYTDSGEEMRLTDQLGKPVIVNFWASWCPPCKAELPYFLAAYEEYGDRITFMMVDLTDGVQETDATRDAFLLSTGYTFPVYSDQDGNASAAYQVFSIPLTVAVDAQGGLVVQRPGSLSEDALQEIVDTLLAG